ncbi:hypothetical protein HRI_002732400 [Hibiscus trionum]|uniref:Uncharacterized protein n=1 Tax=Hibiscus trionum TaxID=183268 RepID=A0A9W7I861_HIBTR|nr:hypothetical protein HRI_002732400 [Hibiscus trionum]
MGMKGCSRKSCNKFFRCLKGALRRARDGYIRILTSCASSIHYEQCPSHFSGQYYELPRSFSDGPSATSNVKEEGVSRELIRDASVTSSSHGNETDMFSPKQLRMMMRSRGLPKNMGRIDEDKPCEFEDNDVVIVERRSKFGIKSQHQELIPVYIARA